MVTGTLLLKKIRQSEYILVSSGLPVNPNILLVQLPATKRLSSPIFRYEVIEEYGFLGTLNDGNSVSEKPVHRKPGFREDLLSATR
jgi:hypothetical protein